MKQMKKMCVVLSAAVLLSGCAFVPPSEANLNTRPSTTQAQQTQTQPQGEETVTLTKMEEIENAWYAATNVTMGDWYTEESGEPVDGVRHYGCYNEYDVIYLPTNDAAITQKQIGTVVFKNNCTFDLYAYRDGRFYDLRQAYDEGWVTEEALQKIAGVHLQYQNKLYPIFGGPVENGDVIELMKETFLRQFVKEDGWSAKDLQVVYYGDYDGAHVGFINGILHYTMAFCSETVGSLTFHYSTGQKLLVYFDGELMRLGEAYDRGILTDDGLAELHRAYQADKTNDTE